MIERFLWPADPAEDWHPCHPRHTVEVRLYAPRGAGPWRVAVWGADDTGMERDCSTEAEARALLAALPNPLPRAWLRARGFVPA